MASATGFSSSSAVPGQIIPPSPETCQSEFEAGVSLSLSLWPALAVAVSNNWGGPDSADKRDWFAGAVCDLFAERPDTDLEDVETVLLQVMLDEFEVNVDDDSGFEIAEQIMRLRTDCGNGDFKEVNQLRERWAKKGGKEIKFQKVERGENDDDTDWDSDDLEETDEENEDIEMGEAPPPKEKPAPEIDEDGFTKVVGKKRR